MTMPENPLPANPHNDGLAQPNLATRLEGSQQVPKNIQDLLAALPEMFPGEQQIPLKNIRPNPDNPGAAITEDQIKVLGENMQTRGLLNHIRVNPDRANPLVGGAQPHPGNFHIKSDGQPWELGDFNFIVLTGENRYRAALWLKWETIPGKILNPTPLEAAETIRLDNDVRERGWWADYESIEQEIKAGPNLSLRQIAVRLKFDFPKVSRAYGLLPLLNADARELIDSNAINQNKGIWSISERAIARLADLGPGTSLKRGARKKDPAADTQDPAEAPSGVLWPYPAIPPETQDLVYRTLVVACDHQMTEKQVQKLVEWVQAGNPPETFASAPKTLKAKKVSGLPPEAADKLLGLGKQLGTAEARGEDTKPVQEQITAYLAETKTAPPPVVPPPSFKVTSPEGFSLIKQKIGDMAKEVFKPSTKVEKLAEKEAQKSLKWFEKLAHCIVKYVWRLIIKNEHKICRKLAHAMVPSHLSSHSSHSHHRSGSFSQGLETLVLTILHWVVYSLLQIIFLWAAAMFITSHFFPGLKPWVETPFHFTARLALVDFPNWLIPYALIHWVIALLVGALLLWGYGYALKVQRARMIILGIALTLICIYGRRWADRPEPLFLPDVSETQVASVPVPEAVRSSRFESAKLKTSNSKLLTNNASSSSAVAFKPTVQPAPMVQKPSMDVAGQVLKQVAPDVAGDVVRRLLPF